MKDSIARHLLVKAPATRLAALRMFIAGFATIYLVAYAGAFLRLVNQPSERFVATGLSHLYPHTWPPFALYGLWLAAVASGVLFTLGRFTRSSGLLFAVSTLALTTYRSSFGMIFHTENLMVVHLFVLACAPCGAEWSLDARRSNRPRGGDSPERRYGIGVQLISWVTLVTYFIAGWSKATRSGIDWATGSSLADQIAHDNLRKLFLDDLYSPLGLWVAKHPLLLGPMAALTLIFELGAPLAILHPRLGRWFAGVMWAFHAGVVLTMAIVFPYPLTGVAFASFYAVENLFRYRPLRWLAQWLQCAQPKSAISP
jgi:hypothetical protein